MNIFDLSGKTVLVTGASSGLGEGLAKCLGDVGAKVVLAARNLEKLENLAHSLGAKNTIVIKLDVSERQSIKDLFLELEDQGERIDICINSAGIIKETPIFEDDPEEIFEEIIRTNLVGAWHITKSVANHMKKFSIEGSIINIASILGDNKSRAFNSAYSISKAGVIKMTKSLVGELSPHKIRINAISPGIFKTNMMANTIKSFPTELLKGVPVNFLAEPIDLYGIALCLASNKASRYITGSIVTVDGGRSWGG